MTDHHEPSPTILLSTPPRGPLPLPETEPRRAAEPLPPLLQDSSFWGMSVTQFLGAFNDNLFKQLLLLLATPSAVMIAAAQARGEQVPDRQAEAMIVFAAAFLLFSGIAGWLADRMSKRTLIGYAKVAEIGVMLLGMVGFYYYDVIGLPGMFAVLFLMGLQSTFFGPPKYGILPEMIHERDLPQANGIFLMFTFVAIIFGTVLAGMAKELSDAGGAVWMVSGVCVLIAVVGTLTSLLVRPVSAANPGCPLRWTDFFVPPESIRLVRADRELLLALVVTSSFWLLGSIVQQAVNALGKSQLGLDDGNTSILAAMLGVGIPVGCLIGGKLSAGRINPRVVTAGAVGIVVCLSLLSLRGGPNDHLLGFYGSIPVLIGAGISTGIFIVPIQVAVQALPPANEKGRMIALMNQCNWVGIIFGALLYKATLWGVEALDQPRNTAFAVGALVMLPIAIFYQPKERALGD
ncbi:MFS transporter [Botrimarina hoheduenensis]|uniref:Lysophospholipid transporter LplT n=1 Tax=Botrimarina hoheduenensis TaxID=2528000 RepID=A0A5C5WFB4_9BACT|nr:MFS transporter [Botrimarina hoheduenensis]TWT48765.1 Lysophospholipid transporter LplT [Botrimarina hoheduenensis]